MRKEGEEMAAKTIRTLNAGEIECRIGHISDKGVSLLLYKDARCDMRILDEVYGSNNWQRKHEVIGGNLYCTVSVWDDEKQQWINKQDVGTKSNTEQEKGEASDAFKRACVSLGIGRELYTAPYIWIPAGTSHIGMKDNRYVCLDKFRVTEISYNENREIASLTIVNQDGAVVYKMSAQNKAKKETTAEAHRVEINKELERTGVALDAVLQRYGVNNIDEMDDNTYRKAMNSLRRTRTKAA